MSVFYWSVMLTAFAALTVILGYEIFFFRKVLQYRSVASEFTPPVSVVVAAKNEAENLARHIPLWLGQNYPDFELVLINDRSTDRTFEILERWRDHPRVKIVEIPFQEWKSFKGNKKYALTMGIKAARHPYLLFTDADCKPASPEWIRLMASRFAGNKEIVLGYGKYVPADGFVGRLVQYETLLTALQYFGFALRGIPYMGVGRNLAYTRELFFRNDGFKSHFEILSGDDDLFVNENATSLNTAVCLDSRAHTLSEPPRSLKAYLRQKRRHYSTARHYRPFHKILLGLYAAARILFWFATGSLLFFPQGRLPAAGMVFVWITAHTMLICKGAKRTDESFPCRIVPMTEWMLLAVQLTAGIYGLLKKPKHWD